VLSLSHPLDTSPEIIFKDLHSLREIWDKSLRPQFSNGGLMEKVLVQRSKMLSGILLIKLPPQLNLIRMPLISLESHLETRVMLLQLTNISHLSKWVSLRCKVHLLPMHGDHQSMRLGKKDNKLRSQFSTGILTEMEQVLRRKISLKILQDKQPLLHNLIKMPLISQEFTQVTNTSLLLLLDISTVMRLVLL
jgi:hypothetical protein